MVFNIQIREGLSYKTIQADGITHPKAPYDDIILLHYTDGRINETVPKEQVVRIYTE